MSTAENNTGLAPNTQPVAASPQARSLFLAAVDDLIKGAALWRIWLSLSWEDLKATYKRSLLGVVWVALGFAIFVAAKVLIFSAMFKSAQNPYYYAYLVTGFFAWRFLSGGINTSPLVFVRSEGWIKNDSLPLSIYAYRAVAKDIFNASFTATVVIAAYIYLRTEIGPYVYMVIPAFLVTIINLVWLKLFLGIISARYRDVAHLVQSVMAVMLFLSPIFWMPDQIGDLFKYLYWNPIFHFMEIIRNPIIDQELNLNSWLFVGVVTVAGWTATLGIYAAFRRRVVFWL